MRLWDSVCLSGCSGVAGHVLAFSESLGLVDLHSEKDTLEYYEKTRTVRNTEIHDL
jgi:hypothetical protein